MVEHTDPLDRAFKALSDPIRRDILVRVSRRTLTVGEIAEAYDVSFAATSKHLKVLEDAELIVKRHRGKEHLIQIAPAALTTVAAYIEPFRDFWHGHTSSDAE